MTAAVTLFSLKNLMCGRGWFLHSQLLSLLNYKQMSDQMAVWD